MDATSEIAITLSQDLYTHMKDEAARLEIPLEWLVASLVVDTMEDEPAEAESHEMALAV